MAKYNRVPLGRAGTGEAYILPESESLSRLMENIDNNRRMGLLNVKAKQTHNAQVNKAFLDNDLKVKSGILFQDEINKLSKDWTDKGTQYRVSGFNPFSPDSSDPLQVKASQEFLKEKAQIEDMAGMRDMYQKNFLDQQQEYQKGGYDEDSWNEFNKFYSENKLADLHKAGVVPPSLVKAFDWADFAKGLSSATVKQNEVVDNVETTSVLPNEDAIRTSVEENLKLNPQAQRAFVKKYGIQPGQAPLRTLLGTTDPNEVVSKVADFFRSPDGVEEALKVFPKGQVPSFNSPDFQFFVQAAAQKQLEQEELYQAGIDDLAGLKMSEVDQSVIKNLNFDWEKESRAREAARNARRRLGIAEENNNRARVTFGQKQEDRVEEKEKVKNPRDASIKGILSGSRKYVDTLRGLVKGKDGGKIGYLPNGNLVVKYMKNKSGGGKELVQHIVDINRAGEREYAQINTIFNELDKEIPIEEVMNKPAYEGGVLDLDTDETLAPEAIADLRKAYPTIKALTKFLIEDMGYTDPKKAAHKATEILDTKGRKSR